MSKSEMIREMNRLDIQITKTVVRAKSRKLNASWQLAPNWNGMTGPFPEPDIRPDVRQIATHIYWPMFALKAEDNILTPRAKEALQWVEDNGLDCEYQYMFSRNEGWLGFADKVHAALFKMFWIGD